MREIVTPEDQNIICAVCFSLVIEVLKPSRVFIVGEVRCLESFLVNFWLEETWGIVVVEKKVGEELLVALLMCAVIFIEDEIWLPDEFEIAFKLPVGNLFEVHPGKDSFLEPNLSKDVSQTARVPKRIELPGNARGHAQLAHNELVAGLEVSKHITVIRTCLIC